MNNFVKFGPSGNSEIFYSNGYKKSIEAPEFCKKFGLSAYEYSFGRGFVMSDDTAKILGDNAFVNNIDLSIHAPYYINLANESPEMAEKSFNYIKKSLHFLNIMKGKHLVVHLASQGKLDRDKALYLTQKRLEDVIGQIYNDNLLGDEMYLCPETMGKYMQIGSYQEIVDFCLIDKCLIPTYDFGHINCVLQGSLKTIDDYKRIFDYSIEKLGFDKVKNCHIHFSKIEYSEKGEIKHLNLDDKVYGPDYMPLLHAINEYNLTPTIICESKDRMMEDAILLSKEYNKIKNDKM